MVASLMMTKFPTNMEGVIVAPERVKVLLEAIDAIAGERDVDYGPPLENHTLIVG